LWPCAVLIVMIGCTRAYDMYQYENRSEPLTPAQANYWERRYTVGATQYAASLGLWCMITLLGSDDAIAHMLCLSVTIGYIAAGAGRNYGRPPIAFKQVVCALGPMCVGLILHGGLYYISLGLLNTLFFFALKRITLDLHKVHVRALTAGEAITSIANQFDAALNNMPNGLCMFGPDGRLAVVNQHFCKMMALSDDKIVLGSSVTGLLSTSVETGSISDVSVDAILAEFYGAKAKEVVTIDTVSGNERALEWTFQSMEDGGTVVLVEDITERRAAQAKISRMARYDELTGMPNRQFFHEELESHIAAMKAGNLSALLFIDLDQFKQVNDTLGHPCGDTLLCMVSNRLREIVPPNDLIGRFGGDEFVILQRNMGAREDASELARRIVDGLSERYEIDHHLVEIGASVGIAVAAPEITADNLLKNADMALYRAKADGRGTFCFFRQEMAEMVEARRTLEIDLRRALVNEEFELYY
ncbi:MAG: diguanylate cyclase, partial [Rhizobiaceae bacterium]